MLIQHEFGLSYDTNFSLLSYKKDREILIPISALKSFCSVEKGDLTLRLKVYHNENSDGAFERQVSSINSGVNQTDLILICLATINRGRQLGRRKILRRIRAFGEYYSIIHT